MSAWLSAASQQHREATLAMGVLKQECCDSSWVSKSVHYENNSHRKFCPLKIFKFKTEVHNVYYRNNLKIISLSFSFIE